MKPGGLAGLGIEISHGMNSWKLGLLILIGPCLAVAQGLCLAKSTRGPASINRAAQVMASPSKIFDNGEVPISADLIQIYEQMKSEKQAYQTADYIPTNLHDSDSGSYVLNAIADRSVSTFIRQQKEMGTSLGRTTANVEKTMKQEMVLGSSDKTKIQHKFNFEVQAFQSKAQIKYSGLADASVSYRASESTVAFEIFEKLPHTQEVVLSHELRPGQQISSLNMRWAW